MTTNLGIPLLAALVWIGLAGVLPRTEAHSVWEGKWKLNIGKISFDKIFSCKTVGSVKRELKVTLECPDIATDEFGNKGHWASVLEYGVEIIIQGRKFYSFPGGASDSNSTHSNSTSTNLKNFLIRPGWSHDLIGNNWACFWGVRSFGDGEQEPESEPEPEPEPAREAPSKPLIFKQRRKSSGSELFRTDHDLIAAINQGQRFWTAQRYPEFENMTKDEMINLAGGKYSLLHKPMKPGVQTEEQKNATALLPKNWDWRNINGKNFVSPVRNQGNCGSCYAFSAAAMLEARIRILTNNKVTPIYSPQDIVDCSPYAEGCDGGYLYGEGKFGEDYGFAEESCNPYKGVRNSCTSVKKCTRTYATDYEFIGTATGGCNDLAMQLAIFTRGPIVVGFTVYKDFDYYKSGIYYHYGPDQADGGHAVTVVGWGEDPQTETRYWIVKNSWGPWWGENGYFRIIRGLNECGIEGMAFQSSPIL